MIDTSFDFRTDANGKDPDSYSPTLKNYHKLLWSKPLPSGELFKLYDASNGRYLRFNGSLKQHFLSSDSITNSYSLRKGTISSLINKIDPKVLEHFRTVNSTIGSFILFPSNKIDKKHTINVERGFNKLIADRFDLSLECIRRFYLQIDSPLQDVLARYKTFFELFGDFKGYVDFFLLNDLVDTTFAQINFFLPAEDLFANSPLPTSEDSYMSYYKNSTKFSLARNQRITEWVKENTLSNRFVWTSTQELTIISKGQTD